MSRAVLAVDLKDDPATIDAYKEHHRHAWPEVIRSLRAAGIRDMEIFLHGRRLVMIVETDGRDVRRCFAAHAASHPRVVEWEALMKAMQVPVPGAPAGEWWTQMERVFRLDIPEAPSDVTPSTADERPPITKATKA